MRMSGCCVIVFASPSLCWERRSGRRRRRGEESDENRNQNNWALTDLTLVLVWPPAVISTGSVTWAWWVGGWVGVVGQKDTDRQPVLIRQRQSEDNMGIHGKSNVSTLTSLSIVLDFYRSVVVSDDILPVHPGAVSQVLVVDNLDSSCKNFCEKMSER